MSRKRLSEAVAEHVSLSKSDAKGLVDAFFEQIQEALRRGESVVMRELGSFHPTPDEADLTSDGPVFKPGASLMELVAEPLEATSDTEEEPAAAAQESADAEEVDTDAIVELRSLLSEPSGDSWGKITALLDELDASLPETELAFAYAAAHLATWPAPLRDALRWHSLPLFIDNARHPCPSLVESVDLGEVASYELESADWEDSWFQELQRYENLTEIKISTEGYTTDTTDTLDLDEEAENYDEEYDRVCAENNKIRNSVLERYEEDLFWFCDRLEAALPSLQKMTVEVSARDERCECWFGSHKTRSRGEKKWKSVY